MYKAKITLDLTFSQFVQAKNYLDDAVPYYIYESNGFTTCHIFGQTIQEVLTHSIFNSFSDILEVSITYDDDDYDDDDIDYESSENTMIDHTGSQDLYVEHLIHNLNS